MGGLYNVLFGWNPACVLLAPMLTEENPQEFFPRFRDCFIGDDNDSIVIYTRVGGGNRSYETNEPHEPLSDYDEGYSNEEVKLYQMPTFIRTWDDDFDNTYGCYEFGVPDEWKGDFENVKAGEFDKLSDAYVNRMQTCYPKLDIRAMLDKAIAGKDDGERD